MRVPGQRPSVGEGGRLNAEPRRVDGRGREGSEKEDYRWREERGCKPSQARVKKSFNRVPS